MNWRKILFCAFAVSSLWTAFGKSSYDRNLDRSWKHYRNPEYGYCVSYPARWRRGDAFDGAGLVVKTGFKRYSRPVGAIDFSAFEMAPADARSLPVSLAETLQDHLSGLQKFERAERMEILEKRDMSVQGSAALFTKHRYYDPQERATWMEEILFVHRNDKIFRFELACRADQIARFGPVFEYLMGTLQFDCPN